MFLIQEKVASYTWVDVYETDDENMANEFLKILSNKYNSKYYRIVRSYV